MNKGCSGEGKQVPRALLEEAGHSGMLVECRGRRLEEGDLRGRDSGMRPQEDLCLGGQSVIFMGKGKSGGRDLETKGNKDSESNEK